MLARLLRRRPGLPPPPPASPWRGLDALVTLGPHHVPAGLKPGAAVSAVRDALAGLPGAGWVSVEFHPMRPSPEVVDWVEPDGTDPARSAALRYTLDRLARAALATLAAHTPPAPPLPAPPLPAPPLPAPPLPAPPLRAGSVRPAPTGFAEAAGFPLEPFPAPATLPGGTGGHHAARELPDDAVLQRLLWFATGSTASTAADRALRQHGSLARVLAAPVHELSALPGLGEHSVAAIKLVHALALRSARSALMGRKVEDTWERLLAYLRSAIARDQVEQFRILFLDAAGRLLADEPQARGTVNHTPVYPREVARRALELRAASLILVHNHPGGDPTPSRDDLDMTRLVQEAVASVGLAVHDHLIVVTGRCLSFREAGLL